MKAIPARRPLQSFTREVEGHLQKLHTWSSFDLSFVCVKEQKVFFHSLIFRALDFLDLQFFLIAKNSF